MPMEPQRRALVLYGGWAGHQPEKIAEFVISRFLRDWHVESSQDLGKLSLETLKAFDILLPLWTFGEISEDQENALLQSAQEGLGVVAWHGAASAFLASRRHKHLIGGQFVSHPGGDQVTYRVRFCGSDALVAGLPEFDVCSEQYYMLVDPAVEVLAKTQIHGSSMEWLAGTEMPVMWKRRWGQGKVFYSSLGHSREILELPVVDAIIHRALRWAARAP